MPENFTVHNVLLDGHGCSVKNFSEEDDKIITESFASLMNKAKKQLRLNEAVFL